MRLVEVVMLMGAHCVSPVEHTQMMTDAAKVQCAVVIEKDTEKGTLTVTPREAAADPQVAAAAARFDAAPVETLNAGGTKIVPAWAPAGSATVETKPPVAKAAVAAESVSPPAADVASADGEAATADSAADVPPPVADAGQPAPPPEASSGKPEKKVAAIATPPQKRPPAKAAPVKKQPAKAQAGQCKGAATPKWYTTADGRKKYRCVKPAGDEAPNQLY